MNSLQCIFCCLLFVIVVNHVHYAMILFNYYSTLYSLCRSHVFRWPHLHAFLIKWVTASYHLIHKNSYCAFKPLMYCLDCQKLRKSLWCAVCSDVYSILHAILCTRQYILCYCNCTDCYTVVRPYKSPLLKEFHISLTL